MFVLDCDCFVYCVDDDDEVGYWIGLLEVEDVVE